MANPNADSTATASIAQQMQERAARLAAARRNRSASEPENTAHRDTNSHSASNQHAPPAVQSNAPPPANPADSDHEVDEVHEVQQRSDYEYALQLQRQFEALDTAANQRRGHQPLHREDTDPRPRSHHKTSSVPAASADVEMADAAAPLSRSEELPPHLVDAQSHPNGVIDRDHEIALRLQREYDQQHAVQPDAFASSSRPDAADNANFVRLDRPSPSGSNHNNAPAMGGYFTFSSNGNQRSFHFGGNSVDNGGSANMDPFGPNGFNHPFFSSNGNGNGNGVFGGNGNGNPFDTPFFRNARIRSAQMHRGHSNSDPFGGSGWVNVNGGGPMPMNEALMNQLMMGGMGGMQFLRPRPPTATDQDIAALTSTDVYRVSDGQKQRSHSEEEEDGAGAESKEDGDSSKKETCSICLEPFKDGEDIRRLPCFHIFHKNEIDRWLKTGNDKCPICRVPIDGQIQNR